MSMFLPQEVRDGLAMARAKKAKKDSRLRVGMGPTAVPILSFGADIFSVERVNAPELRGLVDIYDGSKHLYQALIVASAEEGDRMVYEFKRMTATTDGPALDYDRPDDAPVGLITQQ